MREFGCVNFTFTRISPNVLNHAATSNLYIAHICWILLWAKIARQKHAMAPSYEQNTAKMGEIHGTVNLGFKRPVHDGYMPSPLPLRMARKCSDPWAVAVGPPDFLQDIT